MAYGTSPLPSWVSIQEPDPSDEDLVPNDPQVYGPRKRRSKNNQSTSQPAPKRAKTAQNSHVPSTQPANATAGPSKPRMTHSARSKSPFSRVPAPPNGTGRPQSISDNRAPRPSQPTMPKPPTNSIPSGRTKLVRRLLKEKRRQRSGLSSSESDEMPEASLLATVRNSPAPPSASAPVPRPADRNKLRRRFASGPTSPGSSSRTPKSAPLENKAKAPSKEEIIVVTDSDSEKPVKKPVKKSMVDSDVIEIISSDSEREKAAKRAEKTATHKSLLRTAHKKLGVKNVGPENQEVVDLTIGSDDEAATPADKPKAAEALKSYPVTKGPPDLPPSTPLENGMDLDMGCTGDDFPPSPRNETVHALQVQPPTLSEPELNPSSPPAPKSPSPPGVPLFDPPGDDSPDDNPLDLDTGELPTPSSPSLTAENITIEMLPPADPDIVPEEPLVDPSLPSRDEKTFEPVEPDVIERDHSPACPPIPDLAEEPPVVSPRDDAALSTPLFRPNGLLSSPDLSKDQNNDLVPADTPRVPTPLPPADTAPIPLPRRKPPLPRLRATGTDDSPPASAQTPERSDIPDRPFGAPLVHQSAQPSEQEREPSVLRSDTTGQQTPEATTLSLQSSTASEAFTVQPSQGVASAQESLSQHPSTSHKKPRSITPNKWRQRDLVKAIISAAKHNAQSASAPSSPHPPTRPPLPVRRPRTQRKETASDGGVPARLINEIVDLRLSDAEERDVAMTATGSPTAPRSPAQMTPLALASRTAHVAPEPNSSAQAPSQTFDLLTNPRLWTATNMPDIRQKFAQQAQRIASTRPSSSGSQGSGRPGTDRLSSGTSLGLGASVSAAATQFSGLRAQTSYSERIALLMKQSQLARSLPSTTTFSPSDKSNESISRSSDRSRTNISYTERLAYLMSESGSRSSAAIPLSDNDSKSPESSAAAPLPLSAEGSRRVDGSAINVDAAENAVSSRLDARVKAGREDSRSLPTPPLSPRETGMDGDTNDPPAPVPQPETPAVLGVSDVVHETDPQESIPEDTNLELGNECHETEVHTSQDTVFPIVAFVPGEPRSYDDEEVYYLEYIGMSAQPSILRPLDLDLPSQENTDTVPEDESSSPLGTSSNGSLTAFLMASDDDKDDDKDEAEPSSRPLSPKLGPRRSSRRSVSAYSSSSQSLGEFNQHSFIQYEDDSEDCGSPLFPNRSLPVDSLPTRSLSTQDTAKPSNDTGNRYPVLTWDSYRCDPSNFDHRVYYAKDLPSVLHDHINSYSEDFRSSPHFRQVLEAAIRENTAEDEPDAPLIDVVNDLDQEATPPWEFYYTNKLWFGDGIEPSDMSTLVSCDCIGPCDPKSKTCSCLKRQQQYLEGFFDPGFAYDAKGRLITPGAPIFECNAHCSCDDDECRNRVVQKGRKCSVSIKKTKYKGWGVFATKKIPKGTFIGVYSGEFLRDEDSERRGLVYDQIGRTYLLDIDFYYLKDLGDVQFVVDAYHVGNFTRFLNNSCDPNCKVNPCYINEPDIGRPLITLFALRDIAVGEELCFNYGGYDPADPGDEEEEDDLGAIVIKNKCYCGAVNCRKFMFN